MQTHTIDEAKWYAVQIFLWFACASAERDRIWSESRVREIFPQLIEPDRLYLVDDSQASFWETA